MNTDRQVHSKNTRTVGRFFLLIMSSSAFIGCLLITSVGQWITRTAIDTNAIVKTLTIPATWSTGCLITVPMIALLLLERRSGIHRLTELWQLSSDLLGGIVAKVTISELVLVSVFAGVGEELLFRGFLQSWLASHSLLLALIVPNVLFGILHWISRDYAICTFCVGLYFSCLLQFVDSVNLTALMIAHSLYDLIALLCLYRDVAQRD